MRTHDERVGQLRICTKKYEHESHFAISLIVSIEGSKITSVDICDGEVSTDTRLAPMFRKSGLWRPIEDQ